MINLIQYIDDIDSDRRYISGIHQVGDEEHYDKSLWLPVSDDVYEFLKDTIVTPNGNKTAYYISKDVVDIENMSIIKTDDSLDGISNVLSTWINRYDMNMRNVLTTRSNMYPFKLYNFFTYYNILMSNGIFITDENQEEKYIEIINTENDELIEVLANFLDAKDIMTEELSVFREYNTYRDRLMLASTKEEAKQIYEEFMVSYN